MTRRDYLFPVPAKPLRALLDFKAGAGEEFRDDEAALDVMLALDRDDLRPLRYLAARWGWSKNRVHRALDDLQAQAAEWRSFYASAAPEAGQSLGQAGTGVGQAGTKTGPPDIPEPASGTGVGQAGTDVGQYRTDPDPRPRRGDTPLYPPCVADGPVSEGAWDEWAQHRKEKRKALTPTTITRQSAKLLRLADEGHDPNDVILNSIEQGYTGLYPRGGSAAHGGGGGGPVGTQRRASPGSGRAQGGSPGGPGHVRRSAAERASTVTIAGNLALLDKYPRRPDDGDPDAE